MPCYIIKHCTGLFAAGNTFNKLTCIFSSSLFSVCRKRMTIQDSLQHPWIKVWTEETSVLYLNTLHPVKFKIPRRFYLWQSFIFETTVWVYKLRVAKSPYNWFCTTFISPRIIWILFFVFFSCLYTCCVCEISQKTLSKLWAGRSRLSTWRSSRSLQLEGNGK